MRTLSNSIWLWPTFILCCAASAVLVVLVPIVTATPLASIVRPIVVTIFLTICPGMSVVRFFRLDDAVGELVFAITLSLAIGSFIAGIILYVGKWSPVNVLYMLLGICLLGASLQLLIPAMRRIKMAFLARRRYRDHSKKI